MDDLLTKLTVQLIPLRRYYDYTLIMSWCIMNYSATVLNILANDQKALQVLVAKALTILCIEKSKSNAYLSPSHWTTTYS